MLEASWTEIDFKAINDRGAGSERAGMIRLDHFLARNIEAMEQVIEAGEAGRNRGMDRRGVEKEPVCHMWRRRPSRRLDWKAWTGNRSGPGMSK